MPRFDAIHAPAIKGDRLVFFAVQTLTGLPYRVESGRDGNGPAYTPAQLDPLPPAPAGPGDAADRAVIAAAESGVDLPEAPSS